MEGIVRHARSAQPEMDIVVTHFVNVTRTIIAGIWVSFFQESQH